MATHRLTLPCADSDIQRLEIGDMVYLSGEITVTGGLPAHKRIEQYLDARSALPFDFGGSFLHLPHMIEPIGAAGDYRIHYVNPTTSMRFDQFLPRFVRDLDLRVIGGKGGVGDETVAAMKEKGCVYLSLIGGGSPILSAAVKQVVAVAWTDFPIHFRLSRLRVEELGPLMVGIDARGQSQYDVLSTQAQERLPELLAQLKRRRAVAPPFSG